jgi:exonuclease SbcC
LAGLYLKDDNGFLLMDDPFTDMDPARRKAAAQAIGEFAKERQVLFLTCHPVHAEELKHVAGAFTVMTHENRA